MRCLSMFVVLRNLITRQQRIKKSRRKLKERVRTTDTKRKGKQKTCEQRNKERQRRRKERVKANWRRESEKSGWCGGQCLEIDQTEKAPRSLQQRSGTVRKFPYRYFMERKSFRAPSPFWSEARWKIKGAKERSD